MKAPLKILIVDDHHFFLKGIADCFTALPYVAKVETCNSYDCIMARLRDFIPDLIYLNLNLPTLDTLNICREITGRYPKVYVAVVAQFDSKKLVDRARECGAGAFFIKNSEPEVFLSFLDNFKDERPCGFHYQSPVVSRGNVFRKENVFLLDLLTHRETQVLKLLANGFEPREIEQELGIRYDTVKSHRSNILQKLELKNVAELVKFTIYNNLDSAVETNRGEEGISKKTPKQFPVWAKVP